MSQHNIMNMEIISSFESQCLRDQQSKNLSIYFVLMHAVIFVRCYISDVIYYIHTATYVHGCTSRCSGALWPFSTQLPPVSIHAPSTNGILYISPLIQNINHHYFFLYYFNYHFSLSNLLMKRNKSIPEIFYDLLILAIPV